MITLADFREPYGDRFKLPREHERRADARARLRIDREDFRDLVDARIDQVYEVAAIRAKVRRFVSTAVNPLQMVADRLSVAYRVPPTRSIAGEPEASETWSQLMKETKIATRAKQWGRFAFISNVCHVMPWPVQREGQPVSLRYVTVTADSSDVAFSDDPEHPDALWYDVSDGQSGVPGAEVAFVDSEAWSFLDDRGRLLARFEHGLGVAPFATFRVRPQPPGDYWDRHRGRRMVDATLDVARIVAAMGYVRKDQNKKLMTLFADGMDETVPAGQALQTEHPIVANAPPADVSFQIHDLNTPTRSFHDEIDFHVENLADSFGVGMYVIDPTTSNRPGSESERAASGYAALSELRDQQVEVLRESEHELAYKTALVAERFGHQYAVDPELVREKFEIRFAPLTFLSHPRDRMQYYTEAIRLGLMDHATAYQNEHPELTLEQSEERVMEHAERRARINEFQARRNLGSDPDMLGASLPELQGALGGRPTGSGNDDESDDSPGNETT